MNIQGIDVELRIDKKIYNLGFDGGSGKTYLYRLFEAYSEIPSNRNKVLLITWDKELTESEIIRKIREFKGKLIFIDRFDLFCSMQVIDSLSKKDIPVLLDLKDYIVMNKFDCNLAEIKLEKDKVIVREL